MRFLIFNVATLIALAYLIEGPALKDRVAAWFDEAAPVREPASDTSLDRFSDRFEAWSTEVQDQIGQTQLLLLRWLEEQDRADRNTERAPEDAPPGLLQLRPDLKASDTAPAGFGQDGNGERRRSGPVEPTPTEALESDVEPQDVLEPGSGAAERTELAALPPDIRGMMLPSDDPEVARNRSEILALDEAPDSSSPTDRGDAALDVPAVVVGAGDELPPAVQHLLEAADERTPADLRADLFDLARDAEAFGLERVR